jgi:hypothetical protein
MVEMEIGSFPPIALAPSLAKKGLKLPVALLEASGSRHWEGLKILRAFGLSWEQASLLQQEIVGRGDFDGILDLRPIFEAIPNDPRLPVISQGIQGMHPYLRNDFSKKEDTPEVGRFYFDMCVRLGASSPAIVEEFCSWLYDQKKVFGLAAPKKRRRDWPFFARDLIVFSLDLQKPRWTIEDIDIQLAHIGLPMLNEMREDESEKGEFRKGDLKAIRRKIVFDVKKLVERYKKLPVFHGQPKCH